MRTAMEYYCKLLSGALLCLITMHSYGQKITIGNTGDFLSLEAAASSVSAGDTLELQSQVFADGAQFLYDLKGTSNKPIVIIAKEKHQSIFRGGTEAIHLVRCHHVEINGILAEGQSGNGINIDDGGDYDSPSEHIIVRNCILQEMDAEGNTLSKIAILTILGPQEFKIKGVHNTSLYKEMYLLICLTEHLT